MAHVVRFNQRKLRRINLIGGRCLRLIERFQTEEVSDAEWASPELQTALRDGGVSEVDASQAQDNAHEQG